MASPTAKPANVLPSPRASAPPALRKAHSLAVSAIAAKDRFYVLASLRKPSQTNRAFYSRPGKKRQSRERRQAPGPIPVAFEKTRVKWL
jgi:hypothetical protein